MESTTIDTSKREEFEGKVLGDISAALTTTLATLGDRLGLFKAMADNGAITSAELAQRAGIHERYAREWLGGMVSAGYVEYDPSAQTFRLPAEHAPALAEEAGPSFVGGVYECYLHTLGTIDVLENAFRNGGGVKQADYDPRIWDGMERFSAGWYEHMLTQQWIPNMPLVQSKLEAGASVAEIGCGRGRALCKMAEAYPKSQFKGFDSFGPTIPLATANAKTADVDDRVSFEQRDGVEGLDEQYDVIATLEVVHDAVDPLGLLTGVRRSLKPDGVYVCLDVNCSDKLEENHGPIGAIQHGFSVLYCMTTSLAHDGEGLGTLGFHEPKVRELCGEAGFSEVRRVPVEHPLLALYEIKA
jgi:2-polyprenyl-3-methyl-5-hydroxy-6-metoxy-1,4-benzoquinol methylase